MLIARAHGSIPTDAKPAEKPTIAYGEVTGHHHTVIHGEVFIDSSGKLWVRPANERCSLIHTDHKGEITQDCAIVDKEMATERDLHLTTAIPVGHDYEVRIEEEYTPEGLRRVED
jgi:hypothetical protein